MKVAIVIPKSYNPKQVYKEYPLGAGYIATILQENNYEVKLYDQSVQFNDNQELVNELIEFNPDVIGFSILTATYPIALELIELLNKSKLNAKLIAGGIHPTIFPNESVKDGFHFVIRGEGEISILKLINKLKDNKTDFTDIPNLTFKINDEIISNKDEEVFLNIDKLPIVNRDLYDITKYTNHSLSGTRGCPFSCKFCCNYDNLTKVSVKNRARSVESIICEIEYLLDNYDINHFFFTDDLFFTNIKNLRKFSELIIEKEINITYNAQLRVNMITDEICELLKSSGCAKLEVGAEVGSQQILDDACKGIKVESIIKGIEIAKKNDLRIKTNWIYGLPGNMVEQYKSIDIMLKAKPNEISIHQLIPFPGTEYYDNRFEYGITIRDPFDFKSFCYGDLDDNISYNYMNKDQYNNFIFDTIDALENVGYVSSDKSDKNSKYIYTTPFDKHSLSLSHLEESVLV
ncbi:MAG: radical SAM protein [Peptostreptococcaceae bacterium]